MDHESLRIIARPGMGETLDSFEEVYGMVTRPGHAAEEGAGYLRARAGRPAVRARG